MFRVLVWLLLGLSVGNGASQVRPQVAKLPPPAYPPMALAAHVWGDVNLTIRIRADGGIESAEAISGPPMLRQPAVDLANQTKFECLGCEGSETIQVTYRFALGDAIYREGPDRSYPRIAVLKDMVTITDRPYGTCDYESSITKTRVRSVQYLFLWKCGWKKND